MVKGPQPDAVEPVRDISAEVRGLPAEHDGANRFTFELHFDPAPDDFSYRTVRDSLFSVTNARIAKARRLVKFNNAGWEVTVEPQGDGDITLTLPATTDCAAAAAVCTKAGGRLVSSITRTVLGPPLFSVSDATVDEGEGATLDFAVTLSRAASAPTSVDYATSDGTTRAGEDYSASSGTLAFAAGETSKTVSVAVLDDALDEGSETLTLTLSNPSGAKLGDATATGTIHNTDPMPKAWTARFGRMAAVHVLDAVEERLQGGPSQSWVQLGGHRIGPAAGLDTVSRLASERPLWDEVLQEEPTGRERTLEQLLLGSAFHLASEPGRQGSRLSAWGRVAASGFSGMAGQVSFDGTVTTATLGVDGVFRRWLTGVAVAYSRGEGAYSMGEVDAAELESVLTSLHPYAAYRLSDRVTLWGLVGYGSGTLKLARQEVLSTDLSLGMGAVGVRGEVLHASGSGGGLTLAVRSDALWTQTSTEAAVGLLGTRADATRLRLMLEGSRPLYFSDGSVLTPVLEVGVRHDGGDAETGSGLEVGGRLGYTLAWGLSLEVSLRALLAHESAGYEEWGASGALSYDSGRQGVGLTATLAPSWGMASGSVGDLWSRPDTRGLAGGGALAQPVGRVDAELGYGLAALRGRGLLTPYARVALSEGADSAWHLGTRLALRESLNVSLEATRRERKGDAAAHELALLATVPW